MKPRVILPVQALLVVGLLSAGLHAQNVGIGTNSPHSSARLHISDSARGLLIPNVALTATNVAAPVTSPATSLLVYNTNTAGTGDTAVTPGFYYWNGSQWVRLLGGGEAWLLNGNAGTNPATNFLGTTDAQPLVIRTNNTERMRVTETGNVGIGTTAPTEKLHVQDGSILIEQTPSSSPTAAPFLKLNGSPSHYMVGLRFYNPDNPTNKYVWWVPRDNTLMAIEGGTTDGPYGTEYFRITETGNVGIGTTGPITKLDIHGTNPGNPLCLLNLQNEGTTDNTAVDIYFVTNTGLNTFGSGIIRARTTSASSYNSQFEFYVKYGGVWQNPLNLVQTNVGIGTTAPTEKLHVQDGSILIEQTPSSSPTAAPFLKLNGSPSHNMLGLRFYNPDNPTNKYVWWVPRDQSLMVIEGGTTDGQMGTEYFRITETGNVGIGTTAPSAKLHVVGNFAATGTKSAIVETKDFGVRKLYCMESPTIRFYDEGKAMLKNGMARIELDPVFVQTIEGELLVHITPEGPTPLYVAEKGSNYFVVKSINGSDVPFVWQVSAFRKGYKDVRLERVNQSPTTYHQNE